MIDNSDSQLQRQLEKAEGVLQALRVQEVDAIVGKNGVSLVHALDELEKDRLAQEALAELLAARTAIFDATLTQIEDEENFRAISDAAPVMMWMAALDQSRYWFNRSWLNFTGRSLDQEFGDGWIENVFPEDRQAVLASYRQSFERRGGFEVEYRLRNANGDYRWVLSRGVPRLSQSGEFLGIIGCCTDISPIKTIEQQLIEARDAARHANQAKSAFLASMSHEIRTPMNAILGLAKLVRRDGMTPRQSRYLDQLDQAAEHLLSIINGILDLSKIDAGKLTLEDVEIAIPELLNRLLSMLAPQISAKGLCLEMDTQYLLNVLRGDPTRLLQALLNYANNAIKFTKQGTIRIRTRLLEETKDTCLLRFEISDTGIGVAKDQLERLFSAFEQADSSTTREYGGTGLGLVITRRLAELMGGEAGASSTLGAGSTFWFTARLAKSVSDLSPNASTGSLDGAAEAIPVQDFQGRRILLVDDEPINQIVVCELLSDTGLLIDVADNGLQALEKARLTNYEIILMDMQMPKMDGITATREIRRLSERESVPTIIAMTANAFIEDKIRCLDAGMNDFLTKPVMPDLLLSMLRKWLRQAA